MTQGIFDAAAAERSPVIVMCLPGFTPPGDMPGLIAAIREEAARRTSTQEAAALDADRLTTQERASRRGRTQVRATIGMLALFGLFVTCLVSKPPTVRQATSSTPTWLAERAKQAGSMAPAPAQLSTSDQPTFAESKLSIPPGAVLKAFLALRGRPDELRRIKPRILDSTTWMDGNKGRIAFLISCEEGLAHGAQPGERCHLMAASIDVSRGLSEPSSLPVDEAYCVHPGSATSAMDSGYELDQTTSLLVLRRGEIHQGLGEVVFSVFRIGKAGLEPSLRAALEVSPASAYPISINMLPAGRGPNKLGIRFEPPGGEMAKDHVYRWTGSTFAKDSDSSGRRGVAAGTAKAK